MGRKSIAPLKAGLVKPRADWTWAKDNVCIWKRRQGRHCFVCCPHCFSPWGRRMPDKGNLRKWGLALAHSWRLARICQGSRGCRNLKQVFMPHLQLNRGRWVAWFSSHSPVHSLRSGLRIMGWFHSNSVSVFPSQLTQSRDFLRDTGKGLLLYWFKFLRVENQDQPSQTPNENSNGTVFRRRTGSLKQIPTPFFPFFTLILTVLIPRLKLNRC